MKKIVIIVVVILLLAGGGYAAWKFLWSGKGGESPAAATEEGQQQNGPLYIDMDPLIISITREDRVVKYTSLAIKLEVNGPAAKAKVEKFMPYVRDAFLKRLTVTLSRGDPSQPYDPEKLKRQLMAESENVLGPDMVKDVLISATAERTNPQ
jgi:flagellar FliL protein